MSIRIGRFAVGVAAGAGLLAGAAAGLLESVWLIRLGGDWRSEYDILVIGPLIYGGLGALVGAAIGLLCAAARRDRYGDPVDVFSSTFAIVIAAVALTVFRFLYVRDVLDEAPLGFLRLLLWIVLTGGLAWVSRFMLARLLHNRAARLTLQGCAIVWMLLLCVVAALARILPRAGAEPFHPQAAGATRPSIVYVMIDTLRADALAVYAGDGARTPAATRLAGDGIVFEQAISQAPWTRPSVATQITSLPPHRHGARSKGSSIAGDAIALAEVLARAGYYCVGLYNNIHLAPQWGFARGYHRYGRAQDAWSRELTGLRFVARSWRRLRREALRPGDLYASAETVFQRAREEWEQAPSNAPVYLFLHLMDVHDPYFPRSAGGAAVLRDGQASAAQREHLHRAYRDGVEHADAQLGQFLDWMRSTGRYDESLVVVVSDHGEEFFEHGGYWHGLTLYEEQIHVPLIVKLPHYQLAGGRQPALVRLLDVAPTIASVAGVPVPHAWQGVALIRDGALVDPGLQYAVSETDLEGKSQRALRSTALKLIRADGPGVHTPPPIALFDLHVDGGEQTNLAPQRPDDADGLTEALRRARDGDLWR